MPARFTHPRGYTAARERGAWASPCSGLGVANVVHGGERGRVWFVWEVAIGNVFSCWAPVRVWLGHLLLLHSVDSVVILSQPVGSGARRRLA
jgi:hypothetical protein